MVNHEGWTCPTCRRAYAPWVPSCDCVNSSVGVNTTSMTITPRAYDTAELVEALEAALQHGEALAGGYYQQTHQGRPARAGTVSQERYDEATRAFMAGRAALARVKGDER